VAATVAAADMAVAVATAVAADATNSSLDTTKRKEQLKPTLGLFSFLLDTIVLINLEKHTQRIKPEPLPTPSFEEKHIAKGYPLLPYNLLYPADVPPRVQKNQRQSKGTNSRII
jgi:hypothetical protein